MTVWITAGCAVVLVWVVGFACFIKFMSVLASEVENALDEEEEFGSDVFGTKRDKISIRWLVAACLSMSSAAISTIVLLGFVVNELLQP